MTHEPSRERPSWARRTVRLGVWAVKRGNGATPPSPAETDQFCGHISKFYVIHSGSQQGIVPRIPAVAASGRTKVVGTK